MPTPTYEPIQELLMRNGLTPQHARDLAVAPLRHWELSDIDALFEHIPHPGGTASVSFFNSDLVKPTYLPHAEAKRTIFMKWWPSLWAKKEVWVSAPRHLMEKAAKDKAALCVNVKGEWAILKDGYVALSHVWSEGLQRNHEHGGLEITKVQKVFELMKRAGLQEEWMWTDVLAIPSNPGATLPLEDELLITDLINTMPNVYTKASAVLILDALVMQLRSTDQLHTALALLCGNWGRRMWTFQEVKMANRALIVTATGAVEFRSLIDWLQEMKATNAPRYQRLFQWIAIMGKTDKFRLTIGDLIFTCKSRSAGLDVDNARALFAVLDLKWEARMTREQGMQMIYRHLRADTATMACYAGSRRMKLTPAWAPSYWQGLEGQGGPDLMWDDRGVRGEWYVLKVKRLIKTTQPKYGKVGFDLEVESETDPMLQVITAANEDPTVLQAFKELADTGRCLLLGISTFRERISEWAQSVLVVERAETRVEHGLEVGVYCAAVMGSTGSRQDEKVSVLIRHNNPTINRDLANRLQYHWFSEKDASTKETGDSPIQAAVRAGDVSEVQRLVDEGTDTEVYDGRWNTVLHTAAAIDNVDVLHILFPKVKDVYIQQEEGSKETALTLAARMGKEASTAFLLDRGMGIESRNGIDYTALMVASYECQKGTVDLLLQRGANPNARDAKGFSGSPLLLATGRNDIGLEIIELLIRHGADVNPTWHPLGHTPLLKASDQGNDGEVEALLRHGAQVNVFDTAGTTPLIHAVFHQRLKSVRMLLEAGADRELVDKQGWRALHYAANQENYEIVQLLLGSRDPRIDVNAQISEGDLKGATALHLAAAHGYAMVVKLVLTHGARLDLRSDSGWFAVGLAADLKHTEIVRIIMIAWFVKAEDANAACDSDNPLAAIPTGWLWTGVCDGCNRAIRKWCWHCEICDDGDFDICDDCYHEGKSCKAEGHMLVKRWITSRGRKDESP